jgi:hypothetical protein
LGHHRVTRHPIHSHLPIPVPQNEKTGNIKCVVAQILYSYLLLSVSHDVASFPAGVNVQFVFLCP